MRRRRPGYVLPGRGGGAGAEEEELVVGGDDGVQPALPVLDYGAGLVGPARPLPPAPAGGQGAEEDLQGVHGPVSPCG